FMASRNVLPARAKSAGEPVRRPPARISARAWASVVITGAVSSCMNALSLGNLGNMVWSREKRGPSTSTIDVGGTLDNTGGGKFCIGGESACRLPRLGGLWGFRNGTYAT